MVEAEHWANTPDEQRKHLGWNPMSSEQRADLYAWLDA